MQQQTTEAFASDVAGGRRKTPILTVIAPTYNERPNIRVLVNALAASLKDIAWELVVVDDDSPDGTWREVLAVAAEGSPVRCIRRVGRRGLASAVVEGALAASSEFVAVIDADMQHDERLLPRMLEILRTSGTDIVVASRHVEGGGLGEWDRSRVRLSAIATQCSRLLVGNDVSDPMSGFFMTRRSVVDDVVYDLSQQGYKILLDILSSSKRKLKIAEVPYVFRDRAAGESKLDSMVIVEYALLLIEKFTHGLVPPRFVLFSIVGGLGLVVHLATLTLLKYLGPTFLEAQTIATLVAMTFNFILNNLTTYRAERLRGMQAVTGYVIFCLVCSLGALANLSVANLAIGQVDSWAFAGAAGAIMSAVFNFSVSTRFVWGRAKKRRQSDLAAAAAPAPGRA